MLREPVPCDRLNRSIELVRHGLPEKRGHDKSKLIGKWSMAAKSEKKSVPQICNIFERKFEEKMETKFFRSHFVWFRAANKEIEATETQIWVLKKCLDLALSAGHLNCFSKKIIMCNSDNVMIVSWAFHTFKEDVFNFFYLKVIRSTIFSCYYHDYAAQVKEKAKHFRPVMVPLWYISFFRCRNCHVLHELNAGPNGCQVTANDV